MKSKIFIIFTILVLGLIPIFTVDGIAQTVNCEEGEIFDQVLEKCIDVCGEGAILDESTKQCIPICGEGTTTLENGQCVQDIPLGGWSELNWIVFGIIIGIIVAAAGIIFTVDQRKEEKRKEANELIQKYGNQLSEIVNEENDLKTKLDCALYTERFLDTLEQIAKLYHSDLLGDKVTNYFDNEFRYGRNLWRWYRENVEKYPAYQLNKIEKDLEKLSKKKEYSNKKPRKWILKKFRKNLRPKFTEEFNGIYARNQESHKKIFGEQDRWYHFMERCCWAQIDSFKPTNIYEIIKDRADYLDNRIKQSELTEHYREKLEKKHNVLKDLLEKLEDKKNKATYTEANEILKFDEREIRTILDKNKIPQTDQLEYVRRYSDNAQNKILPDIMELSYEDIPDENGLSNYEILEIVQEYSDRITELKNQERGLVSKQDCAIYAEQYLDLVDEVASLYRQKLFPQSAITYFQNSFGYGVNLMNWYFKFVRKLKKPDFDPDEEITQKGIDDEEDRWIDLRWICRGGDSRDKKHRIYPFDDLILQDLNSKKNANGQFILPDPLYRYEELPDEEGIKPDEVLEIMRGYSDSFIKITEKEREIETQLDCAMYAEQYLDILDQIAYLLNHNALATDSSTFFENNFAFGLTLKIWYDLKVAGFKRQEDRWQEFLKYCNSFTDDDYYPKNLKAFRLVDVLPAAMLFVDELPIDSHDTNKNGNVNYELLDGKITNMEKIYYDWEEEYKIWTEKQDDLISKWKEKYDSWLKDQKKKIEESKDQIKRWVSPPKELTDFKERGDIQEFINEFRVKHNIER